MNSFIKKAKEINRELYEIDCNYKDVLLTYNGELVNKTEIIKDFINGLIKRYINTLPFLIYIEELYKKGKININLIYCDKEYLKSEYEYILKQKGSYDLFSDKKALEKFSNDFKELYSEYPVVLKEDIERAYKIVYKEKIKEEKIKVKKADKWSNKK